MSLLHLEFYLSLVLQVQLLIMNLRKISAIFFTNAVTIIDRKANCEHCQKMPNHVGYNFGIFLYIK